MADKIEFRLDEESKRLINRLFPERLMKVSQGITRIGKSYRKHRRDVFRQPLSLDNDLRWKPLNPFSKAYKERKVGAGRPILTFSGKLARSFKARGASGNITIEKETTGEWGSDIPYAKFHKIGLPNRRIVSRKQLGFIRFGLMMFGKKLGDPIPLPKRDPSTPNLKEINKWGNIIVRALSDNFKKERVKLD